MISRLGRGGSCAIDTDLQMDGAAVRPHSSQHWSSNLLLEVTALPPCESTAAEAGQALDTKPLCQALHAFILCQWQRQHSPISS